MNDPNPLIDLCRELQHLQYHAKEIGLFVDDRELLDCPNCGLFEDVTVEGQLITSRELAPPPHDTGLRFREITANTYQCPACATAINLNEAHGKED